MTRDEAAGLLDVPRSVAAFHLDKLAEAGVVEISFERTSGRTGPGAGRPSKHYRLVTDEIGASLPERRYDLAGHLLAEAVAESSASGAAVADCLQRAANTAGRSMGVAARTEAVTDADRELSTLAALSRLGYDPHVLDDGEIVLSNCPFHRLADEHRTIVCGMNLDFLAGLVEGLDLPEPIEAYLAPELGSCCVRLRPRPA